MIRVFIVLAIFSQTALAFTETYYVRDGNGSYGLENGTSWANAFRGWGDVAFGTGASQVGPDDLLCVDGNITSANTQSLTQGGTAAVTPITIAGSGFASCNDASDTGSGTFTLTIIASTAVLYITPTASYVTLRDITIAGAGTAPSGADGLRIGDRGVGQTGIQIGPNVLVTNISDDGVELNSNTVGGVEIDCNPTFGQIGVSGCSYSLKVDTTRSDGISCRTPGVVARRFEVHNSGRNTSGNNDGLAGYDHATTSSDCFGFDGQYFWVENHGGDPENVGSAAVDWQISELPPVGLEYAYLRSGLITGSVRCLKDLSLDTLRTSGLILQACAPAYYLNFDGRIEYWNNTEYGSQIDFGQTSDGQTAPGTRTATRKNSLFWARDAWLNAPTFSPTPVRVRSGTSPTFNYTLDYNVYRTGTGLGRKDGTPCQAKLGSENACTLATWKTLNIGFGSPWDTNSQEVASDPFVGPLPDVNQENTGTDLVDPTDANTGFRLSVGHATRTAGTAPPSWVRDFCGNTYVDAGGGQYAVGAFEPSNADCSAWDNSANPASPTTDKRSRGGTPATGGIW